MQIYIYFSKFIGTFISVFINVPKFRGKTLNWHADRGFKACRKYARKAAFIGKTRL